MSEQLFIALILLSVATRLESQDHAFGDREIFWDLDGPPRTHDADCSCYCAGICEQDLALPENSVAGGYFGAGQASVWMDHSYLRWEGDVARDLVKLGGNVIIGRNDTTGPDTFSEGVTMPALTLEGVAAEIGIDMRGQDADFVDTYTEHEDFEREAYFAHNSFTMGEIL